MGLSSIFEGKVMGYRPGAFREMTEDLEMDITGMKSMGNNNFNLFGSNSKKLDVSKLVSTSFNAEKDARSKLPKGHFDMLGWQRTKKQKGLKPLGDVDRDRVLNVFDCEPYNRKKQGFIDKTVNLVKGYGFVESRDINPYQSVVESDIEAAKQFGMAAGRGLVSGAQAVGRGAARLPGAVATGVRNVYQASGAPEYFERRAEQQQWEQQARRAAQAEALKYAEKLKAEKLLKDEVRSALGLEQQPRMQQVTPQRQSEWQQLRQGASEGAMSFSPRGMRETAADYVGLMGVGRRGGYGSNFAYADNSAYRVASLVGDAGQGFWPSKVQESVGARPIMGQEMPMQPMQPVQPVQSMQRFPGIQTPQVAPPPGQQTQAQPEGQPPKPGMVWSERSKKWVKYPRGPYKKYSRPQPQAAPPPGPPPGTPQQY